MTLVGATAGPAAAMRAVLAFLLLAAATAQEPDADDSSDFYISVVEESPERAVVLAAAAQAGGALSPENVRFAPIEPDEPLALPHQVCQQAAEGSVAAIGGAGGAAAAARAGLPLLLVDPAPLNASAEVIELYPHQDVLAQAIADLAHEKGWRSAVLLHEGPATPAALLASDGGQLRLTARQLPPPQDASLLRNLLLVLKKSGHVNFIVWCGAARAARVLSAAQRAGLLAERHSYLLPTLDLHTQDLRRFSYGATNITGLMLFDPASVEVRRTMRLWEAAYRARLGDAVNATAARALRRAPPAALLLAHDAAALVAAAYRRLALPPAGAPPDCRRGTGAFHADTLINYIRSGEAWVQSSGALQWRWDGARVAARLQVAELRRGGRLAAAGSWRPRAGLRWARPPEPERPRAPGAIANASFTVLVALNKPYVMRTESIFRLSGNKRYEGFCIELIERLAELLHFNYTFEEHPNTDYNAMLDRLTKDPHIDFAVTDLTITAEREKVVDFTTPFMNLGISILFLKPKPPEPDLWAFLLPFSSGVWLWLGVAYVGTSVVLYVVGRLCPDEWQNPYPCVEEPPALENQFTLGNALWFNLGAVLLQGSEIAPVAYGTRAVASAWWLFALVITSSYTANLATLLSKKTPTEVIRNVHELADNDLGITYGAKENGSTYDFFRNSQNQSELYRKMYEHMRQHQMPRSNELGIERVMAGDYAFLMESTTIEYTVERNCAVKQVGEHLDSRVYGIAMKKNSPYRQSLNMALLNLQERGVLRQMKHVWWEEKHGGGACKDSDGGGGGDEDEGLSMANFRGLWLVLAVGCALGVAVATADLAWVAARRPRDPAQTFARNFWSELKFVFRFQRSIKPLQGTLSPTPSPSPSPTPPSSSRSARVGSGSGSPGEQERDEGVGGRSPSPAWSGRVGSRRRRRSSMYTASVRRAPHTKPSR